MIRFVDVNHLKLVNDTQGHLAGDALLRRVVQLRPNPGHAQGRDAAGTEAAEIELLSAVIGFTQADEPEAVSALVHKLKRSLPRIAVVGERGADLRRRSAS